MTGVITTWRWELYRMALSKRIRVLLGVGLAAPWLFVAILALQSQEPTDTLFGLWVHTSGWATPLVVLGFASSWALPVVVAGIAGAVFAGEDEAGTWPALLTRARSRLEVFGGKTLAALTVSVAMIVVLCASSVGAGLVTTGNHSMVGLSGNLLGGSSIAVKVVESYAVVIAPVLALTMVGLLLSVVTRSSIASVLLLVALGAVMQLDSLVTGGDGLRHLLVTTPLLSWHGLFADPVFLRPLVQGLVVSAGWFLVALVLAVVAFRRREFGRQ